MNNIKLPVNFMSVLKGEKIQFCSLEESIAQFIMIQITSKYGEVAGRPDFGSEIWELEFNQLVKVYEWEEKVRQSLQRTIETYEKRLYNVNVKVKLNDIEKEFASEKVHNGVRRKADIFVTGKIIHQDVPFHFNTTIYISPLSQ